MSNSKNVIEPPVVQLILNRLDPPTIVSHLLLDVAKDNTMLALRVAHVMHEAVHILKGRVGRVRAGLSSGSVMYLVRGAGCICHRCISHRRRGWGCLRSWWCCEEPTAPVSEGERGLKWESILNTIWHEPIMPVAAASSASLGADEMPQTECLNVKAGRAFTELVTSDLQSKLLGNVCDIGAACDVASYPLGLLDIEPVLDHESHQVWALQLLVRAEHVVQQHKVLLVGTGDRLTTRKDSASEGSLDAAKDRMSNVAALVVLVVRCRHARDQIPEMLLRHVLTKGEHVSLGLQVEPEPLAKVRNPNMVSLVTHPKFDVWLFLHVLLELER